MGEGQGRSSKTGDIYAKCWRRGKNKPEEEGRDGCAEPWSSPVKAQETIGMSGALQLDKSKKHSVKAKFQQALWRTTGCSEGRTLLP